MTAAKAWTRALEYSRGAAGTTLPALIDELADAHRDKPALLGVNETVSYRDLAMRMNRYARLGLAQGIRRGDAVALFMPNCPDYVAIWLGLTRIGCSVALINTNLRGDALLHCIAAAGANTVIAAGPLLEFCSRVGRLWNWDLARADADEYSAGPVVHPPGPCPGDRALLIYTSGTTGLPKATNITHRRIVEWAFWFAGMMDAGAEDRIYNCLPMYHSIGGVVAIGSMLVRGGSVVIRDRFSATQFWDDIRATDCTIFQYIGELCRYLVSGKPGPNDREHRIRLACGNGLQRGVWDTFKDRFAIPHILEFYAATEGNLSLYNCEGRPGSVGRVPAFLDRYFPIALVRCDPETGVLQRGSDGFCVQCRVNESGEAISRISKDRQFDGYTDTVASERKVLRNVFVEGDCWFRSGDLMRRDGSGYYYFVDRLGETFRWKGENVSTTEVAAALLRAEGITDAAVYGVVVPGNEGRAGMAAICVDDRFSFSAFAGHLEEHLPSYARPMFVRICASLPLTGTLKLNKVDLAREGYSQAIDPVWRLDHQSMQFHQITRNGPAGC